MYAQKFRDAEIELRKKGRSLGGSIAEVLDSPASRICACFTKLGGLPEADGGLVHQMVRLAFDLGAEGTERYLCEMEGKLKRLDKVGGIWAGHGCLDNARPPSAA
ncbi:hypothetical protein QBC33DRAFT_534089 [Phialemonium atrogriseum]|uniref:Uncharacterized protein n=1 Tax=Phialemonium atrogriseum TaxID=1093897 RepID=A0AAJ0FQ84_9PEZI|nr:uncharacterized protein QBC33DRAFT_534089 [Phialemonium atrogriseum]KAK1768900.1 hypothetical protein QBC33DRAFT_534089 [Phialemonium atrogriseum]